MIIKNFQLKNWNQFENVDIEWHPRLTVLTGKNGAGKSTILRILSKLIGSESYELATPSKPTGTNRIQVTLQRNPSQQKQSIKSQIGTITLANGSLLDLQVPDQSPSPLYSITFSPALLYPARGFLIPSYIPLDSYQKVESVSIRTHIKGSLKTGMMGRRQIKESLVRLAVIGEGNDSAAQTKDAMQFFLGFIDVLKILLPPTLGFQTIIVRDGEVVLKTASGEFLLDAASAGLGSIIDLAWHIYMVGAGETDPFLVLIDEAENHLHASIQRGLLPKLLQAFPHAQFIISTHSPLMVNSVRDAYVYALSYNENNLVESHKLESLLCAANATQIFRDVLGVTVTMPSWVEESLAQVLENFKNSEMTLESYICLKRELSILGLSEYLPQALQYVQEGESP